MMDPSAQMFAIMAFFLVVIVTIGGFVLLMPLSRQLAKFLEFRMRENSGTSQGMETELRQVRVIVEALEEKLLRVSDRQEFVEKILEARESDALKLPR
jgi:hypothetical protein